MPVLKVPALRFTEYMFKCITAAFCYAVDGYRGIIPVKQ